jgi:group I intron endonuclease
VEGFDVSVVYCATTPSGKKYVGITKGSLKKRIREHKCCAKKGSQYPFHRAIRKYGIDSISWETLADGVSHADAKEIEKQAIARMGLLVNGYNATVGGEGVSRKWTDEQRAAMSRKKKEQFKDPELRKRISESRRASVTDELRDLQSSNSRAMWRDPIKRARLTEAARARSTADVMRARAVLSAAAHREKMPRIRVYMGATLVWEGISKEECSRALGLHWRSVYRYVEGSRRSRKYTFVVEEVC